MKYYIIAGEASGDMHGANMIKRLKSLDKQAQIRAWGGDLMEAAGAEVVKHYRDLAFMGFLEVLKNIRTIRKNFDICKQDITAFKPDTIIFVDYPGFNLRMAKWAKIRGYRTQYYISPTIWAWHASRVHKVKAYVDQMFTILPFEAPIYKKYGYDAQFVGHPLLDAIAQSHFAPLAKKGDQKIIALLPGSRKQELQKMLPVFAEVVSRMPAHHFLLAAVSWQDLSLYKSFFKDEPSNLQIEVSKTYDILATADAAIVTSGTATLETALFEVPQVVVYKTSEVTYRIAKMLAKVKYISLPNLILDKKILEELIQGDCTVDAVVNACESLFESEQSAQIKKEYLHLKNELGDIGASDRVAMAIVNDLKANVV